MAVNPIMSGGRPPVDASDYHCQCFIEAFSRDADDNRAAGGFLAIAVGGGVAV